MSHNETTKKTRRGRPKGSPNRPLEHAQCEPSRCRKCGSTDRDRYSRTNVQAYGGLDADGRPYTHIVRRWTRCAACGQARVDRSYENRAGQPAQTNK